MFAAVIKTDGFTPASSSSYMEYSGITSIINTFLTEDLSDIFQHCLYAFRYVILTVVCKLG